MKRRSGGETAMYVKRVLLTSVFKCLSEYFYPLTSIKHLILLSAAIFLITVNNQFDIIFEITEHFFFQMDKNVGAELCKTAVCVNNVCIII